MKDCSAWLAGVGHTIGARVFSTVASTYLFYIFTTRNQFVSLCALSIARVRVMQCVCWNHPSSRVIIMVMRILESRIQIAKASIRPPPAPGAWPQPYPSSTSLPCLMPPRVGPRSPLGEEPERKVRVEDDGEGRCEPDLHMVLQTSSV